MTHARLPAEVRQHRAAMEPAEYRPDDLQPPRRVRGRVVAAMEPAEFRPDDEIAMMLADAKDIAAMEPAEYRPDDETGLDSQERETIAAMEPAEYRPDDSLTLTAARTPTGPQWSRPSIGRMTRQNRNRHDNPRGRNGAGRVSAG